MVLDLRPTFGAMYIGGTIAVMMYGITSLQTYLYYVYYPNDPASMKWLVAFVWVLETLQTAFVTHAIYYYVIANYMNPLALLDGVWSLFSSVGLNVFIAFVVQCFFTKRIWSLCSTRTRYWLLPLIAIVVFAHLCFGMETVGLLAQRKEFSKVAQISLIAATPFAVFAVLSDVVIAGALCVLLHRGRAGSSIRSTNTLVNTLIIFAINRCLLTSVVAVAETIMYAIFPDSLWFIGIDFVIGKLYANSFLATLNTRRALRRREAAPSGDPGAEEVSTDIHFVHARASTSTPGLGRGPSAGFPQLSLGWSRGEKARRTHTLTKEVFELNANGSTSSGIGSSALGRSSMFASERGMSGAEKHPPAVLDISVTPIPGAGPGPEYAYDHESAERGRGDVGEVEGAEKVTEEVVN